MHWWSFLDLHLKKIYIFTRQLWIWWFKEFLLQDDKKTLNKIL